MILDRLDNAARYFDLHPDFKMAFDWLRAQAIEKLPAGRTDVAGDRVYANVMRENGRGQAVAQYETHDRYIDIQYMAEGLDVMGWTHRDKALKSLGYDAKKDLEFYEGRPGLWIPVPRGHFTIFFPEDAHAPMAATGPMVKVVVKVRGET